MKKALFISVLVLIMMGCTSTKLTYVYKTGDYDLSSFKKLAVIAIIPNTHGRTEVEKGVVAALTSRGVRGITTWSMFPMANNTEMIRKAGFEGDRAKEIIRQKVTEHNIDGLLIITLFDKKKEERYVPGSSTSVGIGIGAPGYPVYGYPYYAYYGYAYTIASEPGYYEDASTYFIESNLYDIATEKLLWTGQTQTEMYSTLPEEAEKFGKIIVERMILDSKSTAK